MKIARRSMLGAAAAFAVGAPFAALYTRPARASLLGPLRDDPEGILDLPEGFSYRILDRSGEPMSDGFRVPAAPDGMGCFAQGGSIVLMRNHELSPAMLGAGWDSAPSQAYDPRMRGGVSRLVLDPVSFERRSSNLVLAGTDRNCAGGKSPWGWLSCEESVAPGHGYVFVCPTDASEVQACRRVVGYGRFRHEAAVVDPMTSICYLTEDREDGAFYRFVPKSKDTPFEGRLQALCILGSPRADTAGMDRPDESLPVSWVDIDDPDPSGDTVREEAQRKNAALFRRGEGIFFERGRVYFVATSGGPNGGGQIFVHDTAAESIALVACSTSRFQLESPDNIAVSPWGHIVIAEDGPGRNYLRGISSRGELYDIARNARSDGELAGVCFAPTGKAMFVNLQHDGLTLAITGPFPR